MGRARAEGRMRREARVWKVSFMVIVISFVMVVGNVWGGMGERERGQESVS